MSYSLISIVLPNGFAADGRAKLSLVFAPRVLSSPTGTLDGTALANWPELILPLIKPMQLRVATDDPTPALIPVQLDGALPDSGLWTTLFPPGTPVDTRGRGTDVLGAIGAARSYVQAAADIDAIYAGNGGPVSERSRLTVEQRLDALAELAAIPDTATRADLIASPAAAAVNSIAAFADGLRTSPTKDTASIGTASIGPGNPLAGIRRVDNADFHQVVGLVMNHPTLTRALGLRIDLLMPAFTGTKNIRVVNADGSPLDGDVIRPQSFSRVVSEPATGRFVMATQPGSDLRTEVVAGMLDASAAPLPGEGGPRYLVSSNDVAALSLQLVGLATARQQARRRARESGGLIPDPGEVRLPVRRDIGFTVSQRNRPLTTVPFAADRAAAIENPAAQIARLSAGRSAAEVAALVPTLDGAAVLFADDVTNGYRVDVSTGGGPPRSLMRRRVTYRVGNKTLTTPPEGDEGKVEPITAVLQPDADGVQQLTTGEQMFTWAGYGLSVPKPGPKVLGVAGPNGETTDPTPSLPAPGYDLHVDITAVPGSLPRLRFGREYRFQVRAVDLAGNAIDPGDAEPAKALPKQRFRRKEAAPPPVVVPTSRFTPGESLNHWVVRTNGDGKPIGSGTRRHLVPPKAPQMLAERHGMFDSAFGPAADPAARTAMLKVASREAGSVLDQTVPGPNGTTVPAPGIAYVTNNPASPAIPRPAAGEGLPNGYYVVHNTPAMRTPYLVDPVADGASFIGLPGKPTPVVVPFTGRWPDTQPTTVTIAVGTGPLTTPVVRTEAGRPALTIEVPPATTVTAELATALRADRLAELESDTDPAELISGSTIALSARQPITIVHATQKPLNAPTFVTGPTVAPIGAGSTVKIDATLQAHAASTSKVEVVASWRERLDTGEGELVEGDRTLSVGSVLITPNGRVTIDGRAHFGDLRHRTVELIPSGTSAFREYFDVVDDRDPRLQRVGQPVTVSVPNRLTPPLLDVHSVLPTFSWSNSFDPTVGLGLYSSTRTTTGVRVYLRRPGLPTGEGERLGVVVHRTAAEAEAARVGNRRVQDFVSQWGDDSLQESGDKVWLPMTQEDFANSALRTDIELIDPGAKEKPAAPGQPQPPKPMVTVVSFPLEFDAERNLWFADVTMDIPADWPFVKLAVLRLQSESTPGKRISRVVLTDFVQLPPSRTLNAQRAGGVGVKVDVLGPADRHSRFQLRQERRIGAPLITAHDLGSSVGVGPTTIPDPRPPDPAPPLPFPVVTDADGWRLSEEGPSSSALGRLRLVRSPNAPALNATVKTELLAGRVVVEEIQTGMDVRGPGRTTRVVWTDVFDRSILGMT